MSHVDPIPPGPRLTPYLVVRDAKAAIDFYSNVFGMTSSMRIDMDDGRVGHVELALDGARIYLADEFPEMGYRGPEALGGSPVGISLYVEDVDAVAKAAVEAGAEPEGEIADQPHGDRTAKIRDPFGHRWMLMSRVEDVSEEEIARRYAGS